MFKPGRQNHPRSWSKCAQLLALINPLTPGTFCQKIESRCIFGHFGYFQPGNERNLLLSTQKGNLQHDSMPFFPLKLASSSKTSEKT